MLDDVLEQPALDLGGDPLARVLGGVVEDGRPAAVLLVARVLGDLVGDDVLAEHALADDDLLHDVAVGAASSAYQVLRGTFGVEHVSGTAPA